MPCVVIEGFKFTLRWRAEWDAVVFEYGNMAKGRYAEVWAMVRNARLLPSFVTLRGFRKRYRLLLCMQDTAFVKRHLERCQAYYAKHKGEHKNGAWYKRRLDAAMKRLGPNLKKALES